MVMTDAIAAAPLAEQLDTYLRANNIPIVGVCIGDRSDRSTWKGDFAAGATPAQKAAAASLIAAFVPNDNAIPNPRSL